MNIIAIISLCLLGSTLIYTLMLNIIKGHEVIKRMELDRWINQVNSLKEENSTFKSSLSQINDLIYAGDLYLGTEEYFKVRHLCTDYLHINKEISNRFRSDKENPSNIPKEI